MMERAQLRIEVFSTVKDARGDAFCKRLRRLGFNVQSVIISDNYLVNGEFSDEESRKIGVSAHSAGHPEILP